MNLGKVIREVVYSITGAIMYYSIGFEITTIIILCFIMAGIDHKK